MRSNQAKHKTAPKGSPIFRRAIVVMLTLALSIACYGVTVFAWFQTIPSLYLVYICSWSITAIAEIAYFASVYKKQVATL